MVEVDYALSPQKNETVDVQKKSMKLKIPFKFKKGVLFYTAGVSHYNMSYVDVMPEFGYGIKDLENYYNIQSGLGYSYPLKKNWRISGQNWGNRII